MKKPLQNGSFVEKEESKNSKKKLFEIKNLEDRQLVQRFYYDTERL